MSSPHYLVHTIVLMILLLASGFTPKKFRTTYSLKNPPPPPSMDPPFEDDDESRKCHSCLFFEPHFENGRTVPSLGKCVLFGDMEMHEYAVHCRSNVFQCGPDAFCYVKKRQTYLQ